MKVVWTAQAQARLAELHTYVAEDQHLNADRLIDRLTRRGDQIGSQPYSGRAVPEYRRDDLREILEGSYRIIYLILDERIDIVTVRHGAKMLSDDWNDLR
ncbi:MAG: type II toxin-antitoxin system RelE/ParE family toxin [Gammaproteobacteria bacterium]